MADNDDKDHGKAGAEDPKPAAAKPAAPKPAATAKTAPKRRRPGASKAQKDKAPEGESETKPVPADAGAGPDSQSESKPKPLSMKIRTLGVGLVLAIVVGAGAWFTVSAWMDRPARDGLGSQLRSLERMVDDLEGKLGEAEKKLAGEETKQLAPGLSQTPGPGQTGAGAAPPQATPKPPQSATASPPPATPKPPAESAVPVPAAPSTEAPAPEAPGKIPGESDRLKVTVDDLSGRLKNLEQQLQSAAVSPPSAAQAPLPPLLALLGFHNAIARGAPFAAELAMVERSFAGNQAALAVFAPLKPWSGRGVATVARLQSLLEAQIPEILRAARPPVDDSGPWLKRNLARSWERLQALVVIRRVGEDVPGIAPDAIIARAEAILAKDDIAGAVTELSALEGAAAAAAKDWLAQARARLAADAALAAIIVGVAQPPEASPAQDDKAPAPKSGNKTNSGNGGRR
ncbi:MAG: mitofilin family membrane protein [Alphaproteobacteria bacterium]